MTERQEITKMEWKESLLYITLIIVLFSVVIFVSAFVLLPDNMAAWLVVITVCVVILIVALALIVRPQEKEKIYKCPTCGQEFGLSTFKSTFAPHGVTKEEGKWYEWKYLECPMCHGKARMYPVKKE